MIAIRAEALLVALLKDAPCCRVDHLGIASASERQLSHRLLGQDQRRPSLPEGAELSGSGHTEPVTAPEGGAALGQRAGRGPGEERAQRGARFRGVRRHLHRAFTCCHRFAWHAGRFRARSRDHKAAFHAVARQE